MTFNRVLLKVSGEAFSKKGEFGIDFASVLEIAKQIKIVNDAKVKVGVVVGGGNLLRGRQTEGSGLTRERADYMGMMATSLNGIALSDALTQLGCNNKLLSPLKIDSVADYCSSQNIEEVFEQNSVAIFVCGTGKPFVSTDTGAAARAVDMKADVILCAKAIDGVYDADPHKVPTAKKFAELTYDEVIEKGLTAIDLEAIHICKSEKIKLLVFAKDQPNSIVNAAISNKIDGTIIY